MSKLNSFHFQPGDSIRLKRGDLWYNQSLQIKHSGSNGNPITYIAYGIGSSPEISGYL